MEYFYIPIVSPLGENLEYPVSYCPLTYGETYTIIAVPEEGYILDVFTINGEDFISGSEFIALGPIHIVCRASIHYYDITATATNCSLEFGVYDDNSSLTFPIGENCYNSAQRITLHFFIDTGYELNSFTMNGITYDVSYQFGDGYTRIYSGGSGSVGFNYGDLNIEATATLRSYSCSVSSYNPFGGIYSSSNTLSITHNGVEILTNTGEKVITYGEEYIINAIPAGGYIASTITLNGVLIENGATIVANQDENWSFRVDLVDLGEQDFDLVINADEHCAISVGYLDENNQMMGIWPGVDVLTSGVEYFIHFSGLPRGYKPETLTINGELMEITSFPCIVPIVVIEDLYLVGTTTLADLQDLTVQSENCQVEISTNRDNMEDAIPQIIINPGEDVLTFGHEYYLLITPDSGYVIESVTINGEILTKFNPIVDRGYYFRCWGETNIVITTVSYQGLLYSLDDTRMEATLIGYMGNETEITIPSYVSLNSSNIIVEGSDYKVVGIGSMGNYVFMNYTNLTSIIIPETVRTIGLGTFNGCVNLTSIILPPNLLNVFGSAFANCTGLTSIVLPNSITILGGNCFENCTNLTSITLPNSITWISDCLFRNCTSLTSIIIPESVVGIGYNAFANCTSLTSITIPNSVTYPQSAIYESELIFENCNNLTDIYYDGTEAEWNLIACNISYLTNVLVHFI